MTGVRRMFIETGRRVVELLRHPDVAARWEDPGALDRMTVGALAGHLSRAVLQVDAYLDAPASEADPIDAAAYFLRLGDPSDLDSNLNAGIRDRAEEAAAPGPEGVADAAFRALDRLSDRLPAEPANRRVEAFGVVLALDAYLETRLVEMAVHFDDLRVSIAADVADLEDEVLDVAARVLWEMAVRRHGRRAVLTALARRERDFGAALRVL